MDLRKELDDLNKKWGPELYNSIDALARRIRKDGEVDALKKFYEECFHIDDKKALGKFQQIIATLIKEELNDRELISWVATFGDAWKAFLHLDEEILCEFDGGNNFLHLLLANKGVSFDQYFVDRLLPFFQKNIRLFFAKNDEGVTPCDLLKKNPAYIDSGKLDIKSIFESHQQMDAVRSGHWARHWDILLAENSSVLIKTALKEEPALVKEDLSKNEKSLLGVVAAKYRDFLIEQLFFELFQLMQNERENADRIEEIETAFILYAFEFDKPLDKLAKIFSNFYDQNKAIVNKNIVTQAATHIKSRFANTELADHAEKIRQKAIISTILSFFLVGIPFAIYFWLEFNKAIKPSHVHVFEMPASTYARLSSNLRLDNNGNYKPDVSKDPLNSKDELRKVISVQGEEETPLFMADEVKANERLRVLCSSGSQTERFEKNLKSLNPFDRFTVAKVL